MTDSDVGSKSDTCVSAGS